MSDVSTLLEKTLSTTLGKLGIEHQKLEEKEVYGQVLYNLTLSEADEALFIAGRGDVLYALSTIVSRIIEKELDQRVRITIDINDHKRHKIEAVIGAAKTQAERAKKLQYDVELQPANGYERMLVHAALADDSEIKTGSIGEGHERRVVITFVG